MQDSYNSGTLGMEVEVGQQRALECRKKYELFESQFSKMQNQFQQSQDRIYFIVSSKFIRQWKDFCSSTKNQRIQPQPMNHDLVDQNTKNLKQGLIQSEHFQIISLKVYEYLTGFQICQTFRRVAYGQPKQKKVPIYTKQINYLTLNQTELIDIDKKTKTRAYLKLRSIRSLSDNNTGLDLMNQIIAEQLFTKNYKTRLWKHQKDITMDKLYDHIVKQCKPQSYQSMKIKGLGKLIQDNGIQIGQLNLQEGDYFILQCILYDKSVITSADQGKCQSCYTHKKLTHFCNCKIVAYCSQECLEKDKKYHLQRCKFAQQQQLRKPIQMNMTERSRRGLVGLQNLGNTCFMNSSLQCLSHTLPLTLYFIGQSYASQINRDNPIGSKGRLAQAYANFIKNMWCQQERIFRPFRLKGAISDINKMFLGYAQHDSQELFSFLVDGIHEDLNRIKIKPYVQSVDSNGRSDQIVSRESWLAYVQRNQSIITDTMVGQYKSKVICPDCQRQSITFDPFITMTLPIPEKSTKELKLYVLYNDNLQETEQISIVFKKKVIQQIYLKVASEINRKPSEIELYVLSFDQNIYPFSRTPEKQLFAKIDQESQNIFAIEVTPQERMIQNRVELLFRFSKTSYASDYHPLWYKRPFWFNFDTTKGIDLIKRVLKYLYNDTYDLSVSRCQKSQSSYYRGDDQKPKTYEQYEELLLQNDNRPFQIYLRWGKKLKTKYTGRVQAQFEEELKIKDQQSISKLIQLKNIEDYQIDVRFNSRGLECYSLNRLKKFSNKIKSSFNNNYDDEQSKVPLSACFQAFQNPELLEKGNQWYCPNCKDHKLATKQMYIYKLPQILILHLKRFKVKGVISRQKNQANIDFPFQLNMEPYIQSKQPINSYIPYIQSQNKYQIPSYNIEMRQNSEPIYELYAVSNHYGSLGGGHYTAFAKNNQKWFSFNDSSVSAVQQSRIKGSGAYMLFYRRK